MNKNTVRTAAAAAALVAGLVTAGPAAAATQSGSSAEKASTRIGSLTELQAHLGRAVAMESQAAIVSGPVRGLV